MAGGVIKFTTHSIMSIGKINDALRNIYAIRRTLFGLKVRLRVVMIQINIKGSVQNVPTVELEIPFSYNEIATGAGTTIGTLMDAQAKHLAMGALPAQERMKELSMMAEKEGYDGSQDAKPVTIDAEVVKDEENSSDSNFDF